MKTEEFLNTLTSLKAHNGTTGNASPVDFQDNGQEGESMNSRGPALLLVMERFPDHGETLERLYGTLESFLTLCNDYEECRTALDSCSGATGEEAAGYRNEWAMLLDDHEQETLEYLRDTRHPNRVMRPNIRVNLTDCSGLRARQPAISCGAERPLLIKREQQIRNPKSGGSMALQTRGW